MPLTTVHLDAGMDINTLVSIINQNFTLIENANRTNIIRDKDGTPRVLLGLERDGFSGIKVSKPGFDVTTAADPDLLISSDWSTL